LARPRAFIGIGLVLLNLIYLYINHPAGAPQWRLFRRVSLWLDAKESELKARAKRP
jgi:hypothetical protein